MKNQGECAHLTYTLLDTLDYGKTYASPSRSGRKQIGFASLLGRYMFHLVCYIVRRNFMLKLLFKSCLLIEQLTLLGKYSLRRRFLF